MTENNISEKDTEDLLSKAAIQPADLADLSAPAWYAGLGEAPARGVAQSLNMLGMLGAQAGQPIAETVTLPFDETFGTDFTLKYDNWKKGFTDLQGKIEPDPEKTGWAANLVYGISSVIPLFAIGSAVGGPAAGAALAGAATGLSETERMRTKGVDDTTALEVGAITGAATGVGGAAPAAIGKSALTRIASGAGINLGLGAVERGSVGEVLSQNGYDAMADQYRVLDGFGMTADVILGGFFGGLSGAGKAKANMKGDADVSPSNIDVAHAVADIYAREIETAPGIPADIRARNAHTEAFNKATDQLLRDEPVNVGNVIGENNFVAPPESTARVEDTLRSIKESHVADLVVDEFPPIAARIAKADVAITPEGKNVDVEYAVVEAQSLIASQMDDGRTNPAYPAILQPRDRSRVASQQQIQKIANKLNPRLLAENPLASEGAPIIDHGGVVESGNGRVLAIRKAYNEKLPTAEVYRQYLQDAGYDIEGIKEPVLVRIRREVMSPEERVGFAQEANQRTTASMSATEQGMTDAKRMSNSSLSLYRGGDIFAVGNRDFVRALVRDIIPLNEQGAAFTPEGDLSQSARNRFTAALLYRAYGDDNILRLLVEETDAELTSLGKALIQIAPDWSQMRELAAAEVISKDVDITNNLVESINLILRSRREGKPLKAFFDIKDMFSGGIDVRTELMVRAFHQNDGLTKFRGFDKLTEMFRIYVEEAKKTSSGVNLFGDKAQTPEELWKYAESRAIGQGDTTGDIFARQPIAGGDNAERGGGEAIGAKASGEGDGGIQAIVDDFTQRAIAAGEKPEVAAEVAKLEAAHYEAMGKQYGVSPLELYRRESAEMVAGDMGKGEQLFRLSADTNAPAMMRQDSDTLLTWLGVQGKDVDERLAAWHGMDLEAKRDMHERVATSFERYLREGKAPNSKLAAVFEKFKQWLTEIYKSIDDIGEEISPEVREVFDRFLDADAVPPSKQAVEPDVKVSKIEQPEGAYATVAAQRGDAELREQQMPDIFAPMSEDGEPTITTAENVLKEADAIEAKAMEDADLLAVAVDCFLENGQ